MDAGNAFEGVLIEFIAAPDDGMREVLPDSGGAIERANDNTERENSEQEQEVPAREDGKELEGVEDGRERAIAWQGILLYPGSISGGIVERFARRLHKVDAEQADDGDGRDEQNGGAHRTKPAPGSVNRMPQHIGESLAKMAARLFSVVVTRASAGAAGRNRSGASRSGYGGCRCGNARRGTGGRGGTGCGGSGRGGSGRGGSGRDKSRPYFA